MVKQSFLLIALFMLIASIAQCQAGLSVSPMKLVFDAPPGGTQSLRALVSNAGEESIDVGVSLSDWKRDSLGRIHYAPVGTLKNSCAKWLKILPATTFTLKPSETKQVMVVLKSPDSALSSAKNAMVLFSQLNPIKAQQQKKGISILLAVKVGVQIFYNPPGVYKKDIEILNFRDKWLNGKDTLRRRMLYLTLKNRGNVETDGKVTFELNNLETGAKTILPGKKFYTLPGAAFIVREALPANLSPGSFNVTAIVDYGTEYKLKIGVLEFKKTITYK
jgi:P pilus assembly chaperone PapD